MNDDFISIRKKAWGGKVIVSLTLASDEINTIYTPEKYYLTVARRSYFPLYWNRFESYFRNVLQLEEDTHKNEQWWLDYNGTPIKWHYPIGLLYDIYNDSLAIWDLIIHFKNFPADQLLTYSNDGLEANYYSAIKEADYLQHRSKVVNSLQRSELKQLWECLMGDDYYKFWDINNKLCEVPSPKDYHIYHVPFRIYRPNLPLHQKLFPFYHRLANSLPDEPCYEMNTMTKLLSTCGYAPKPTILPLTLIKNKPSMTGLDSESQVGEASGSDVPRDESGGDVTLNTIVEIVPSGDVESKVGDTLTENPTDLAPVNGDSQVWTFTRCICQGIDIPLDAPLVWLYENLSHPDNFLHITLLP